MRRFLTFATTLALFSMANAQRTMETLDRALVALPNKTGDSTYVSWRTFGTEYYDVAYNLYRNGVKINGEPLEVSNFLDANTDENATYSVAPVVRGKEGERSKEVARWKNDYLQLPLADVYSRRGTKITQNYVPNDCCAADMDGDGEMELIVKRINNFDANDTEGARPLSNDSAFNFFEVYKLDGRLLWRVDCGPNVCSIGDVELNMVAYDWDGDGQAEALLRVGDDAIIHKADGTTQTIGVAGRNYRSQMNHGGAYAYTRTGEEYLVYLNGATGEPYVVMDFPLKRLEEGETDNNAVWGDDYGHRSSKYFFGAPYLDGRKPSIFLARGIYTQHKMIAYDVDPQTHRLVERWRWFNKTAGEWFGQGYHNFSVADVDMDGRDEIVYGSMVIDDNGQGLSTCGLGHGDAHHCGDFDPYNHGLEIFCCNEDRPACNYRDATTSDIFYRLSGGGDDGRCMFGNFTDKYPGAEGRSNHSDLVGGACHDAMPGADWTGIGNIFRIYWDGDLLEDCQGGIGVARYGSWDEIKTFTGCVSNNGTKGTPSLTADLLGDWREEVVLGTSDGKFLRIYHTQFYTPYRNYTLMHDHQYRNGVVWEMCGYNQPPHASYFLGNIEAITVAPPPLLNNGRIQVEPGGTITTAMNGQHVLLAHNSGDAQFTIAQGAQPYILTVNAASWVQGHTDNKNITRDYYTFDIKGAPLSGEMRLVKQGDGKLILPANVNTYTGETNIWGGTVQFDGELTSSPVRMNMHTSLVTDGGNFGKGIAMRYGSCLDVGRKGVTTASLDMEFGARLVIHLYPEGEASCIHAQRVSMGRVDWKYGPQLQRPVIEFVQHKSGDHLPTGRYLIMETPELDGELSDIIVEGMSGTKFQLLYDGGKLYIDILPFREATTLTWTGACDNRWDFDHTENFADAQGNRATFVTGDKVLFDDSAERTSIMLADEVLADELLFRNNTKSYVISASNDQAFIGSTATLVKEGDGKLTINSVNRYKEGTVVRGGTLQVKSVANEFEEYGSLGLRSDEPGKIRLEAGGCLHITDACNLGSPILAGEGGGIFSISKEMEVQRPFSGTQIEKQGNGTLKLYGDNGKLAKWICGAGQTELCNDGIHLADTLEFRGGTFQDYNHGGTYSASTIPVVVPDGCSGIWNTDSRCEYRNKLFGSGTLTWKVEWYRESISGDWSKFEGTVKPIGNYAFPLDNSYGLPKATLDLSSGLAVSNGAKTFRIGRVTGTGSLGGLTFTAKSGSNTWQLGWDGDDWSWDGVIEGSGTVFEKVGQNNVTLTGESSFTGLAKISEGTLTLNGGTLGTGALAQAKGTRLVAKTTTRKPLTNSSYTFAGELLVGTENNPYTGSLYLNGADVSFSATSTLCIGIRRAASKTINGGTCIEGAGKLTFRGTLQVQVKQGVSLAEGDSVRVWTAEQYAASSAPKFCFINAPGEGLTWDTSRISEGLLFVVAGTFDAIDQQLADDIVRVEYFTLGGVKVERPQGGAYLVKRYRANGTATVTKQIINKK